MFHLNGKVHKYAGPPGTGKSTTLLGVVERYLKAGCDPEDILYTTFTRAGSYEARDRACARFNLSPARLPHFRTLHSLCYQELGKQAVMTPGDWCAIAKILGLSFTLHWGPSEGVPRGRTRGDMLVSLWSLARVRMEPLRQVYEQRDLHDVAAPDLSFEELEQFVDFVTKYKSSMNRIDYTDMLEMWLNGKDGNELYYTFPGSKYVIVDEAQDLSLLQWKVVEKLTDHATEVHVAGDDDQCIHEWNGAAPALFIGLESESFSVLPQSYRIPSSVHELAGKIIALVPGRLEKEFAPRAETGLVERVADVSQVDMSQGSWLVLARNNHHLEALATQIRLKGLSFSGYEAGDLTKIYEAIRTWKILIEGQPRTAGEIKIMYNYMSQRDRVTRGFKKKLNDVDDQKPFTYESLKADYGLVASLELPWHQALDLVPEETRNWLQAVERKEPLGTAPRIELSTIHGAKGREADHVLLSSDMTFRTWDSFQTSPAQEHRVWYVAVTRARKSLHILQPTGDTHYPL